MNGIKISNLNFEYKKNIPVIKDLSLSILPNESVGIIGANGAGKSTLLKILVGLAGEFEGNINVNGLDMNKENLPDIRQRLGYVFQDSDSQLFMNTVYEDVAFAPRNYGMSEEEVHKIVTEALKRTHTEDIAGSHIYRLSGGQKKLVAIATVLSTGSDVMLMDEPSAALDPSNRENLISILNDLSCTKIIASHDLDFIYDTCERTIILSDGRIAYDGATKETLKNEELLKRNNLRLPLSFRYIK